VKAVLFSFLFLYVSLAELFLGSLAILCFRAMVPAAWLEPFVEPLERAQRLRWPLLFLFPLLALAAPEIFPWAGHENMGTAFRHVYLTPWAFFARGAVYWGSWLLLSRAARRRRPWAGTAGLVWLFLTGTFASVDWILSLEESFPSTIFGTIFLLSAFLLAFGVAAAAAAPGSRPGLRQDQGSVHLTLICVWTYLTFIQFLVVWSGNLPHEMAWYVARSRHGWQWIPALLALFQFFVPLLLLVQSRLKRSPRAARALAFLSVFWQALFVFWQILPSFRDRFSIHWSDALAWALLAAVCLFLGRRAHAPARA
jgi:hypothetical protein